MAVGWWGIGAEMTETTSVRVELLLSADCPNASGARRVVADALDELGLAVAVDERVGDFPSPTVLVDGVDVMTDAVGVQPAQACRLDVPTRPRMLAALRRRVGSDTHPGVVTGAPDRYPPSLLDD